LTTKGSIDADRRNFDRWALAPSLITLFVVAGLPALYLLVTSLTPFQLVTPGS
jgi:multiple sugar transport system permease protein